MSDNFFLRHTAPAEFYTLSLHDALPICRGRMQVFRTYRWRLRPIGFGVMAGSCDNDRVSRIIGNTTGFCENFQNGYQDRKSTRLNSSHRCISYAVFCLKKKKEPEQLRKL